jgi:hypothetical protein
MVSDSFRLFLAILSWCQSTPFFMIRAHFMFSSWCEAPKKIVHGLSCPSLYQPAPKLNAGRQGAQKIIITSLSPRLIEAARSIYVRRDWHLKTELCCHTVRESPGSAAEIKKNTHAASREWKGRERKIKYHICARRQRGFTSEGLDVVSGKIYK